MFPAARFIHVYRDPFVVFQSTLRMYEKAAGNGFLQRTSREHLENAILRRYRIMYDAFFEDRSLIPEGQLHEVRFEDLEADKINGVRKMYERLNLSGWEEFRPTLEQYVNSLKGFEKNRHPLLGEAMRARIAHLWHRCFEEWGYDTHGAGGDGTAARPPRQEQAAPATKVYPG
jgi:hypothetical protein